MDDLVDTTEMYLKSVLELEEEGVVPLRARISERLEQAGPTVSQTVARMERDGLLTLSDDRRLELTDHGRERAVSVMRKHRLAECFLTDVVGLDWEYAHEEACRWEHVMSDKVEVRLAELLGHPERSPYGNPIPSPLGDLPTSADEPANLVRFVTETQGTVSASVYWLGEPLQVDPDGLRRLKDHGVVPGARGDFTLHGPSVLVRIDGRDREWELGHAVAAHVFVTA